MMDHDAELLTPGSARIAHRMKGDIWQYWSSNREYWKYDENQSGPDKFYDDPIVSYDDTWAEPEEDDA